MKGQARVSREQGVTTRYFRHYEALEDAFRCRINTLLPRAHAGTARFWKDFQRLFKALPAHGNDHCELYITSNPRDCLAFGTPRQVLQAAMMTAAPSTMPTAAEMRILAGRYGLQAHLNQPVRSLSGGETVRLALAKAFIGATGADRLTLASPFSWLSLDNRRYFFDLAAHCRDQGKCLEVFALEGEDNTLAAPIAAPSQGGTDFRLSFRNARVVLNSLLDRLHDRRRLAAIEDGNFNLVSPCLIQGDNGQGKSLVAKVLAGAALGEGHAGLETDGRTGPARLLLQDLVNQTMMRRFRQLAAESDSATAVETGRFYNAIRDNMLGDDMLAPGEVKSFEAGRRARSPATLLELKLLLAARRLASESTAIIMDEPDWGLRQSVAMAFVRGVIHAAHGARLPVLLISHKPWWQDWAGSILEVRKALPEHAAATAPLFHIHLKRTIPLR